MLFALLKGKRKVPFSCFLTAALSLFASVGGGDLVDDRDGRVEGESECKHVLCPPFSTSSVLPGCWGIDSQLKFSLFNNTKFICTPVCYCNNVPTQVEFRKERGYRISVKPNSLRAIGGAITPKKGGSLVLI